MSSSLSNLVDNLSEGLHNDRCIDCKSCLDYITTKDEQLIFRCFECKRIIRKILIKSQLTDLQVHISFAMETLINLFCY